MKLKYSLLRYFNQTMYITRHEDPCFYCSVTGVETGNQSSSLFDHIWLETKEVQWDISHCV